MEKIKHLKSRIEKRLLGLEKEKSNIKNDSCNTLKSEIIKLLELSEIEGKITAYKYVIDEIIIMIEG